jgi:phage anti-repressor protein
MPGSIDTGLPGVPVTIDLDTKNFAMVEFPSSSNGYRRMRIRSRNKVQSIILKWQLAD